ncbi:MAG: hypothetical protein ACTH2A_04775, partial [Glutamicibacter ardleyensis]
MRHSSPSSSPRQGKLADGPQVVDPIHHPHVELKDTTERMAKIIHLTQTTPNLSVDELLAGF